MAKQDNYQTSYSYTDKSGVKKTINKKMADYEKQIMIENYPRPTTIEGMKEITNRMSKCICK